jgi:dicarboxylate/amino acid:cation (Na+ or H+) symporter, DAACS family
MTEAKGRGPSLHTWILIGLVLGAIAGTSLNFAVKDTVRATGQLPPWVTAVLTNVTDPVGKVFLRLLLMTVVPLVFASLALGVAQLGDLRRLGRIGAKTFAIFVGTMTLATVIGLTLVNTIRPGESLPQETREALLRQGAGEKLPEAAEFGVDMFVNIVPRNPLESAAKYPPDMLGVIFFALLVGVGVTRLGEDHARLAMQVLQGINDVMVFIIGLAMRVAPFGVFALIFGTTTRFGIDLLVQLGVYVLIVLVGLAIQMFGTLSVLVRVLAGLSPLVFFRKVRAILITAFSTSSSNATLPTSIKVSEEELGVPPQIAGFVLPLGATMNMNGTALFEGVTVMFLAQVYGVEMGLGKQVIVVVLAVITAIGAAGVPGGSIPLLLTVLGTVGVPPQALGLILGVDRLLDMCRTTLNVIGDVATAAVVTKSEGFELLRPPAETPPAPEAPPGAA